MHFFTLTGLELTALINSLLISLWVGAISVLIAVFLAGALSFFQIPAKRYFSIIFIIPLFIPPYLHAFSWMHFLMFLGDYHLLGPFTGYGASVLRSLPGVIFILTLSYFPIAFFIIQQAMRTIPQELIDTALLSVKPSRLFRKIIFPLLIPSLSASFMLTFIITFIAFDVPAFLGKKVFVTEIFSLISLSHDLLRVAYLSIIPVVITAIICGIFTRYLVRNNPILPVQHHKTLKVSVKQPVYITVLVLLLFGMVFFFSVAVPLGVLQLKSLLYDPTPFRTVSSQRVIINTLVLALVSSICIVFTAFMLFRWLYKTIAGRIIFLSFLIVPSITFGLFFIYLFNTPYLSFIYTTPLVLICAYLLRFTPLISEIFYMQSKRINPYLLDAAQLVSAPSWNKFKKIILPLFKPAFFLAWVFSFWLVATELPITLLVQPPGFLTIIVRLFIVAHYGAEELMSLLTLILLLISTLPIAAIYIFLQIEKTYA